MLTSEDAMPLHRDDNDGDLVIAARHLTPTEAHMLCGCLTAAGIPAETGDTHMVQAHSLLSLAVGGACIRVPERYLDKARSTLAALQDGDFSLDENFDPGPPHG
ncbi:hypothetical protein OU995_12275 [Roseateles sp. SL47]|uniref:hypothetical protein n=1 Tax=Roseateles sp. SL47 TaxID=2995138 RepID=UPI002270561C|nr:hypothetical protein [Roseateles sp. SL47]WAC75423.1 hypothetical protein OU995_12275 [Roseateles sp. SL47]